MKRVGNLFDIIFSKENLYAAYLDARTGKRSKAACMWFDVRVGAALAWLHQQLHAGTYQPRPYKRFYVYEPKKREICAPWFGDIVVQHAIYRVVWPIFDRCFISTSFACRPGYGTHRASDYAQSALRQCDPERYTMKLDIRKFFYRIDRGILERLLARKIKDKRLLAVMMSFASMPEPVGIPIGNLLSQMYALIYMNQVDHFIKRQLKVRLYCRYVDDFILFNLTREQCETHKGEIEAFLQRELNLEFSRVTIQKVRRGVNFVGYRTWRTKRFIRKYSLFKYRRAVRKGKADSVISILGHARRTQSLPYMARLLAEQNPELSKALPVKVRKLLKQATQSNAGRSLKV